MDRKVVPEFKWSVSFVSSSSSSNNLNSRSLACAQFHVFLSLVSHEKAE